MKKIEDVILVNGAPEIMLLREYMKGDFCKEAVEEILRWEKGTVLLATGFYVGGYGESDGPAGTICLERALKKLGYKPVVITDHTCEGYFELMGAEVVYIGLEDTDDMLEALLAKYEPVGMISIERCGKNLEGYYANVRNCSISSHVAPVDRLFELAYGKIPTIGIGDRGNEIGMGNMADIIRTKTYLVPSRVKTDVLVIATVSNWGAFGMAAYLEKLTGITLFPDNDEIEHYYRMGCVLHHVDGLTREVDHTLIDGINRDVERNLVEELREIIN